jgi:glucokinase
MTDSVVVAIDLGGTNLKAAVVDREGRLLVRRSSPTDVGNRAEDLTGEIRQLAHGMLGELGLPMRCLAAVGVGSPGPLSPTRGVVHKAANLPGLIDAPIAALVTRALDVPAGLDNDANLAAWGESWIGAGRGVKDMVFLTLGTGIGGGVILNGRVLHGSLENAGEIGHLIAVPDGLQCNCGQRGCLEAYASASAIARIVTREIEKGESSILAERVQAGEPIDGRDVCEAAEADDPLCLSVWDDACRYLALACINLQHSFSPQRIILGGGMGGAGAALLDRVRGHFDRQKWHLHNDFPQIVLAELGNDAGVIGAARLAWSLLSPAA